MWLYYFIAVQVRLHFAKLQFIARIFRIKIEDIDGYEADLRKSESRYYDAKGQVEGCKEVGDVKIGSMVKETKEAKIQSSMRKKE